MGLSEPGWDLRVEDRVTNDGLISVRAASVRSLGDPRETPGGASGFWTGRLQEGASGRSRPRGSIATTRDMG